MKRFNKVRVLLVGAFAAAAAVSCGTDSSEVPVSGAGNSTAVESSSPDFATDGPGRIVSLSPTHTEIIFAIGAGPDVVAVDAMSNYPAEAQSVLTELSGYEPNVESIVAFEPDLVVIGDDYNGLAGQLEKVGIESWTSPAPQNLEEVLAQIEDLGTRVGRSNEASELADTMRAEIEEIVAGVSIPAEPVSFYHELDDTYFTVTSNTFVGYVYGLFGLRNIADAAEDQSDYPQLSAEFIISRNPDLIFLADTKCCAVTPESLSSRPGWESLQAVRSNRVIALDDDVASRWGPRIVDFVRAIADAVADLGRAAQ